MGVLIGSASMWDTDALMWQGLGNSSMVKNYYSTGNSAPIIAKTQSTTFKVTDTSNNRTSITTRRKLDPNVANQFAIRVEVPMQMGFAANDHTYISTFLHSEAFVWDMTLPSDGTYASAAYLLSQIGVAATLFSACFF